MDTKLIELRKELDSAKEWHQGCLMTNVANITPEQQIALDIQTRKAFDRYYAAQKAYEAAISEHIAATEAAQ